MIQFPHSSTLLLNYKPLALNKKICGFFSAKKNQPVFRKYFKGDYDNQAQVLIDSKISNIKNTWSKHEHIHCSVLEKNFSRDFIVFEAFYYFPFRNPIFFRDRIYLFYPNLFSTKKKTGFQMEILQIYLGEKFEIKNLITRKEFVLENNFKKNLSRCSIFWNLETFQKVNKGDKPVFLGQLLNGGCTIFSYNVFEYLQVKDDLILSEYSLWKNDRGFDHKGDVKYGNAEKIFYKLERTSMKNYLNCTIRKVQKKI